MKPRLTICIGWYLYLPSLFLAVFTPDYDQSAGLFGFLNIEGSIERILNFFLLMPLGLLVTTTFSDIPGWSRWIIGPTLSGGIEILQRSIPGRTSDWVDVIMNSLGYLLAVFLVNKIKSRGADN